MTSQMRDMRRTPALGPRLETECVCGAHQRAAIQGPTSPLLAHALEVVARNVPCARCGKLDRAAAFKAL